MYSSLNNHHRLRRHHNHHHHIDESVPVDPHRINSPDYQPASAGSLRRHIAASLMRHHHQSSATNKHALQPLSPASYGSSLEIAPYNPAATPDSSIELRGKFGDSNHTFKTSTELLKVLNRIWTLEEQHASNISLVKALKHELDVARARIKELVRDQQSNRHEINELTRQITEDSLLARQTEEQDRLGNALQSVKKELEDERKLRKRSEGLHRKLAKELFEVKVDLSSSVKELERERRRNDVLERLCDEFAAGVREYAGRLKPDVNRNGKADHDGDLVLQLSESWLDERMQMKDGDCKLSVVERLGHEIETFLATRRMARVGPTLPRSAKERHSRRRSLESIPEASGAPQDMDFEESGLSRTGPDGGQNGQNTPRELDPTFMNTCERTPEVNMLKKSDVYDSVHRKKGYDPDGNGSNPKGVDKLMSELLLSDYKYKEAPSSGIEVVVKRNVSPVRQWSTTSMKPPVDRVKDGDNSLKSKLREPKVKGQRSKLKILKDSSQ